MVGLPRSLRRLDRRRPGVRGLSIPLTRPEDPVARASSSSTIPGGFLVACSARPMSPSDGPPVFLTDSVLPSTLKSPPAHADTVLPQCPRLLTIHRPRRVSSSRFPSVGAPFDPSHPNPTTSAWSSYPSYHREIVFRPRGFSPPRRLAPDRRREHCCSSLPTLGFTTFPATDRLHRPSPEGAGLPARSLRSP